MEHYLTWNKGFFDSNYQLFKDAAINGSLLFDNWKNEARGIGLESNIYFKTEGFLNPITKIFNDKNELIGSITYDSWHTKATINMANGEIFSWSFTNSWLSQWSITDFKGKQINYHSHTSKGTIVSSTDDVLMLLAGIFIREYYARILIVIIIAIFIPIFSRGAF